MEQTTKALRESVISLGKEVAESNSTTQFPEWIHFKIGISALEGIPFDIEFWENRTEPGISDASG